MDYYLYNGNAEELIQFLGKGKKKARVIEKKVGGHFQILMIKCNNLLLPVVEGDVIFFKKNKIKILSCSEFTKKMFVKGSTVH